MDFDNGKVKVINFFKELIPYVLIIIFVLLIKTLVVTPIKVNGSSMAPTLMDGDLMILDMVSFKVKGAKRFDVVVADQGKELLIKRVIGLPGETVEIKNKQLYIDGLLVKDPFADKLDPNDTVKVKLKKDEYYILGDNRDNSLDSRTFGPFKKSKIKGKTDIIFYPFYRMQVIKYYK